MAHYEPPHLDLHCLKIDFLFLFFFIFLRLFRVFFFCVFFFRLFRVVKVFKGDQANLMQQPDLCLILFSLHFCSIIHGKQSHTFFLHLIR